MRIVRFRTRTVEAFLLTVISIFYGIECCQNQTILCSYSSTRQEVCNNALCKCAINVNIGTRHITCNGVLSEIPLGQFQERLDDVLLTNNNITIIKNRTFSGLSTNTLSLQKNKIIIIESAAFQNIENLNYIDLSGNFITAIGKWTFSNLPYLVTLHLSNNVIMDIEQHAFVNLPKLTDLHLSNNVITDIEQQTFVNLPKLSKLNLQYNNISVIKKGAFRDMLRGEQIMLYANSIEEIQSQAFQNILEVSIIILSGSPVKRIQSYAFSNLDLREIVMSGGMLQHIEQHAFYNITGDILVVGVSKDLSFEENLVDCYFDNLYFTMNPHSFNCNCSMMWIALWIQDVRNRESIRFDASCNDTNNTPLANLTLDYFSYCRGMPDRHECRETDAVIINCSLSFVSGNFIEWIHSRNGRHIRTLKTLTDILSIPFCSLEDIGDYTCVRSTLYSAAPYINATTTLHVQGKPIIVNHQTHKKGADLELSVTLYTSDVVNIQWLHDNAQLTNDAMYMISTSAIPLKITQYNTPVDVTGLITNLTIRNYNSLSTRTYMCRISNEIGTVEEVLLSGPIDIVLQPNTLCDTSSRLEIDCTLNADGVTPKYFKHTVAGKLIRTLTGSRVNNTFTLVIPFCNSQDQGDYTCYWETGVSGLEEVSKTTTLTVNGPPIIQHHTETEVEGFVILSVMFLSYPYPMEPQWFFNDVAIVPSSDIQHTTSISVFEMKLHNVTAYVNVFMSNLTIKAEQAGFGYYKCVIKNGYGTATKIITRYEGISSPSDKTNVMPVALGSVAAGVTIVVIILVVVFVKKRQQKTQEQRTSCESTDMSGNGADTYDSIGVSVTRTEQDYVEITE